MYVAQKIELKISKNSELIEIFNQAFGYKRYCYNKALDVWISMYNDCKNGLSDIKPSHRRVRDTLKQTKEEWEENQIKMVLDTACEDLGKAFNMLFKKVGKYPKYKTKRKTRDSFRIYRKDKYTIQIKDNKYLKLPKLPLIKMKENLKYNGPIKEVTISKKANKYFASFIIECDNNYIKISKKNNSYVGIDLGVKTLAIINDTNGKFKKYKSLNKKLIPYYNKINHYNKILSRKIYKSNNYERVRTKLNLIYMKIDNIKKDYLHKITTNICKNYKYITIEDLNINGLLKNKKLSEKIAHSNWYMFKVFLEYKSLLHDNKIIIADRWFPSSQICSYCGNVLTKENKLKLSDRIYKCPKCGESIDRDYNAAINLKLYGMRSMRVG